MKLLIAILLLQLSCGMQERSLDVRGHKFKRNSNTSDAGVGTNPNQSPGDIDGEDDLDEPPRSDDSDNPDTSEPTPNPDPSTPGDDNTRSERLFTYTYPVKEYKSHTQNFFLTPDTYENKFSMRYDYETKSQSFKQKLKEIRYESFTQGSNSKNHDESFLVNSQGIVDILLVVDNSISMRDEIDDVSRLLPELISYINQIDWRIAITTTDPRDPAILGFIDSRDSSPEDRFRNLVGQIKADGSNNERGIYQAKRAINSRSFMRDSSDLAVLFISDEDNCSDGTQCQSEPRDFISSMRQIRNDDEYTVYSLIKLPSDPKSACGRISKVGYQYQQLTSQTNGLSASICEGDYSSVFSSISANIRSKVNNRFTLTHRPSTLKVYVNGIELNSTYYTVNANILSINSTLAENDSLRVIYQSSDKATNKIFSLKNHSDDIENLNVRVNKSLQEKSSYSLSANELIFSNAPAANAVIEINYTVGNLKKHFILNAASDVKNDIRVTIGSVLTRNYTFDANSKTLSFSNPPKSGSDIYVVWQEKSKKKLSYKTSFSASVDVSSIEASINGQIVSHRFNSGVITINDTDFKDGVFLNVSANKESTEKSIFPLDFKPELSSLAVATQQSDCDSSDFLYKPNFLSSNCPDYFEDITISYMYESQRRSSFAITDVSMDDVLEIYVYVDGVLLRSGFTLRENVIEITSPLSDASFVTIEVVAYSN